MTPSGASNPGSQAARRRVLAFYLPQFHPIPENDEFWGKGFTEWNNVVRAQPQFPGHYQPHLPGELGFYDLRLPEIRQAQADLAREHGIDGFCYYHYWFNGNRPLGRPLDEVRASGKPDFPFCLCWANEDWTRYWDGYKRGVLLQQTYTPEDDLAHIRWLAEVFRDPRYIRVEGKPFFIVYRAGNMPDSRATMRLWREEARRLGIGELFLARVESLVDERDNPLDRGFDAAIEFAPDWLKLPAPKHRDGLSKFLRALRLSPSVYGLHRVYEYQELADAMLAKPAPNYRRFPCVTPIWDNTARRKRDAIIFNNPSPQAYQAWLTEVLKREDSQPGDQLVFLNAWNEWAEGAHLEPDAQFGRAFLEATRDALAASGAPVPVTRPVAGSSMTPLPGGTS